MSWDRGSSPPHLQTIQKLALVTTTKWWLVTWSGLQACLFLPNVCSIVNGGWGFKHPTTGSLKNNVPNLLLETEELTPIDPINYSNASFVRATVEIGLVNLVCHILLYPKYPWPSQHDIFFIKVSMISVAPLTYRVYMTFALTFINGDIYILTYIP